MNNRPVVLVVEDDTEMNDLERELLEYHGMDSIAAYSGKEALDMYDRYKADAVMLDIMLPEMDGFEACLSLRRMANHDHIPIVMLSALDGEDCRRRGYEAGADAYFTKPFDPDEVVAAIRLLLLHPAQATP